MAADSIPKFLAGGVAAPLFLLALFCAIPKWADDLEVAEPSAVLWTGGTELQRIPFVSPLWEPQIRTASDGTLFALGSPGHKDRAERFDPTAQRFSIGPDPDGSAFPFGPPHTGWDAFEPIALGGNVWFVSERSELGKQARTAIFSAGRWFDGPALPLEGWVGSVTRVAGGTLVVTESASGLGKVFVSPHGDRPFVSVTPHGASWVDPSLTAAHGGRVLLVALPQGAGGASPLTRILDPETGMLFEGPSLTLAKGEKAFHVSGDRSPVGLVFALSRRVQGFDHRWIIPNVVAAITVVAMGFGLVKARRRRWLTRAFWVGALAAGAALGLAFSVFMSAMNGLAHM